MKHQSTKRSLLLKIERNGHGENAARNRGRDHPSRLTMTEQPTTEMETISAALHGDKNHTQQRGSS